jgi:transcription initiation factor TFIIIB Brf1 subunit/transcription initiation factor TFIIB
MFCPMCGTPNEEDSIFCANCGAVLAADAPVDEAEAEAHDDAQDLELESVGPEQLVMVPPPLSPQSPRPPRPPATVAPSIPTSGMAIASLVLGIGGVTILPLLGSIAAIILGYMARSDIRNRPTEVTGDGLALAGIVLGWISVGLAVLGLLFFGAFTVCGLCGVFSASGMQ